MKKAIKILLTLALVVAALGITAAAEGTNGFYDIGTADDVVISAYAGTNTTDAITGEAANVDADDADETYYEGSDRLGVTYSAAKSGADYGVILVEGISLPTASNAIYYIDQVEASGESIAFDVYPATITAPEEGKTRNFTMYISSNAEGAGLVSVPMNYVVGYEEKVEVMYGDVSGDGKINAIDVSRVKKHVAGTLSATTTFNATAADVNVDGKINAIDVSRIKKAAAGQSVQLGPTA